VEVLGDKAVDILQGEGERWVAPDGDREFAFALIAAGRAAAAGGAGGDGKDDLAEGAGGRRWVGVHQVELAVVEVHARVDKRTGRLAGGERVDEGAVGAAAASDLVDEGL
jgi:hypothetical protein